ncbi:unnamed protein product [Vitrella brassicaformis CCMP3155]|uniref:MIF4G domain-containing protein n=1 Tax=Vitrella brassicaformis (strain CCMP3155) TaxID=1169540 RepID=A0A0G4GAR0_VITBC|nr:unnamed protein product [Vitrella brassicaformis CCMP3155]|eukprot:CEM26085.1 unnamed protein product [Vitrella brassicaformis CCMP3155]
MGNCCSRFPRVTWGTCEWSCCCPRQQDDHSHVPHVAEAKAEPPAETKEQAKEKENAKAVEEALHAPAAEEARKAPEAPEEPKKEPPAEEGEVAEPSAPQEEGPPEQQEEAMVVEKKEEQKETSETKSERCDEETSPEEPPAGVKSRAPDMKETKDEQNEAVLLTLKGILDELTTVTFDRLYQQILDAGITQNSEIESLVGMVFEKATTQHDFIEMYSQLCVRLKDDLKAIMDQGGQGDKADGNKEGTEEDKEFRRVLLNRCQESFEKYLKPPDNLKDLTGGAFAVAYFDSYYQMLGNFKFVGQLMMDGMLSAKALFVYLDELWDHGEKQGKQGEAQLECVCTFLKTIGPVYNMAQYRADLQQWFHKLAEKSRDATLGKRVRRLMKDVLDLRTDGWRQVVKPGKVQGPSKLRDIHRQHESRGLAPPSEEGVLPTPSAGPKPPAAAAAASASSSRPQEASRVQSGTPGQPTSVITSRRVIKGSDLRGDRDDERRERRQRREREKEEMARGTATTPTPPPTQPTAADERSTSPTAAATAATAAGGGAEEGTSPQPAPAAPTDEDRDLATPVGATNNREATIHLKSILGIGRRDLHDGEESSVAGEGKGRKAWADVSDDEDVLPQHHQHRGESGTPQRRDEEDEKEEERCGERKRGGGGDRPSRPPGRDRYDEHDDRRRGGGGGGRGPRPPLGRERYPPVPAAYKGPYGLILDNIHYEATKRDVEVFLTPCRVDHMMLEADHRNPVKNLGRCYVQFDNRRDFEEAWTYEGRMMLGRRIRISTADEMKYAVGGRLDPAAAIRCNDNNTTTSSTTRGRGRANGALLQRTPNGRGGREGRGRAWPGRE